MKRTVAKIRAATAGDAAAVTAVYLESRKRHVAFAPLAHADQEVSRWIAETLILQCGVHVLENEEGICAMLGISIREKIGWIDQLYVHPEKLRRGYGGQLLAWAKTALPSPIRLYAFQANAGARKFYEAAGFSPMRFSDGQENEERCPDILYEWRESIPTHATVHLR